METVLKVMARLRSPTGCPWDREQTHLTLRFHAVEEVYELLDAIESADDAEIMEELGDLLLQVVFHCQLARERGAFDFNKVCQHLAGKLIRRHPHVFGRTKVRSVNAVWKQWEQIKRSEKMGTVRERPSAFDGIPRHLPALLRAEKLLKKARKSGALSQNKLSRAHMRITRRQIREQLFRLAEVAQKRGWSAEELLRGETKKRERAFRAWERIAPAVPSPNALKQRGGSP